MSAIYDKAMKRKDLSGTVTRREETGDNGLKENEKKDVQPQTGADIGKIVNLMAGDASRIAVVGISDLAKQLAGTDSSHSAFRRHASLVRRTI